MPYQQHDFRYGSVPDELSSDLRDLDAQVASLSAGGGGGGGPATTIGVIASRPAASAASGAFYLATDDTTDSSAIGGTLYLSDGTAWRMIPRSMHGLMGWFNVVDYGADRTGVVSCSSVLNTIIGLLDPNRAGTVYFPQGIYLLSTAVTCTVPGATFVGEGAGGLSSTLAKGDTQIRVGNGIWGLTLGSVAAQDYRGYVFEGLHFYELNAGQATGLVRVLRSGNGRVRNCNFGDCTAGIGFLLDGTGGECPYWVFEATSFGNSSNGYKQIAANGVRMMGCTLDGHANTAGTTAGSIGLNISSGDTFRFIGGVIQGYDTLADLSANVGHVMDEFRGENFGTQAVILRGGAGAKGARIRGTVTNSINGGGGIGVKLESGVVAPVIDMSIESVATPISDLGSTTPFIRVHTSTTANLQNLSPFYAAGGLSGATAASRWVGATASGAPASGTFAVGDFVIDQTGKVWICTSAGSPGTWTQVGGGGGGGSLSSVVGIQSADVTMTTAGTYYDGPSVSLAAGTWLCVGQCFINCGTTAVRNLSAKLWDGTTAFAVGGHQVVGTGAAAQVELPLSAIVTPGSTTTYKISATSTVNGETLKGTSVSLLGYLNAVKIA